jgi:hypothetical protein
MMAKAQALGLTMDSTVAAQYGTLPAKFALDALHETWKPADGPLHLRPVSPDAAVANSVAVRVQYGLTYAPGNLALDDGSLADSYALVTVVDENA